MGLSIQKWSYEAPAPYDPDTSWDGQARRAANYNGPAEWPFRRVGNAAGFGEKITPQRGAFVAQPPNPWRFGVPRLPNIPTLPTWFWWFQAADWADQYFLRDPGNNAKPDGNYWYNVNICDQPEAFPPGPFGYYYDARDTRGFVCIAGQAPGSGFYLNIGSGNEMWRISDLTKWWSYEVAGGGVVRAQQRESWVRIRAPDPAFPPDAELVPATEFAPPAPNPNWLRSRPNAPSPAITAQPAPEAPPPVAVTVGNAPPQASRALSPVAPTLRGPPDHKVVPRTTRAASFISKVLGSASEAGEVVEAVYKALPQDVRTRWERGRDRDPRPFGGQYAVSSDVTWQLQAIYYNWSRLDAVKAIQNLGANYVEDMVLGTAYGSQDRLRPRNAPGVFTR